MTRASTRKSTQHHESATPPTAAWGALFEGIKLPTPDLQALAQAQAADVALLQQLGEQLTQHMQDTAQRQAEWLRSGMEHLQTLVQAHQSTEAQRAEQAREAFAAALTNARELAERSVKVHEHVFTTLQQRVQERMAEISGKA